METINPHQEYIDRVTASLTDDSMALIDFDELRQWLCEIAPLLSNVEQLASECATLHEDMVGRISGMMKAVAAVQRSESGLESIADYLEALPQMNAPELVRQYRRTSARFRDAFRASFYGPGWHQSGRRSMDPDLYK